MNGEVFALSTSLFFSPFYTSIAITTFQRNKKIMSRIILDGEGYDITKQITCEDSILHIEEVRGALVEGLSDSLELLLFNDTSEEIARDIRGDGVYVGKTGVVVALGRLLEAERMHRTLSETTLTRVQRCFETLLKEIKPSAMRRDATFLEGKAGVLAVLAHYTRQEQYYADLISLTPDVTTLDEGECELLYGRAGYLHALLFVQTALPQHLKDRHADAMKRIVKQIINTGLNNAKKWNAWAKQNAQPSMSLVFEWHNKMYFGAAHGICGILHTLLQCPEEILVEATPTIFATIKASLNELAALQLPSGNYPSSQGNSSGRLNQFCHGSTGFVLLYCLAYEKFGDTMYLDRAVSAANFLKNNIVIKGVGLCHGVSGNTYPLLAMYRATKDPVWLQTATHITMFLCHEHSRIYQQSERPLSLYEGVSGMVALLTDILASPSEAKFPGFEV